MEIRPRPFLSPNIINIKVFLIKLHLVEMSKRDLSEADIKAKFITPSILKSGWDELTQIGREIYFTDGRIYVKGKLTARGKRKFADYFWTREIPRISI